MVITTVITAAVEADNMIDLDLSDCFHRQTDSILNII